ncbi:MAG: hypothetical protein AABZ44_09375, partial [Elusimicrobiota bacterium]
MSSKAIKTLWVCAVVLAVCVGVYKAGIRLYRENARPLVVRKARDFYDKAASIDIKRPGQEIELRKQDGRWSLQKPKEYAAREKGVDDILMNLRDCKVLDVVTNRKEKAVELDLGPGAGVVIEVKDMGGAVLASV